MLTYADLRVSLSPPPHSAGLLPLPRRPRLQLPTSPGRLPLQVRLVFPPRFSPLFFFRFSLGIYTGIYLDSMSGAGEEFGVSLAYTRMWKLPKLAVD